MIPTRNGCTNCDHCINRRLTRRDGPSRMSFRAPTTIAPNPIHPMQIPPPLSSHLYHKKNGTACGPTALAWALFKVTALPHMALWRGAQSAFWHSLWRQLVNTFKQSEFGPMTLSKNKCGGQIWACIYCKPWNRSSALALHNFHKRYLTPSLLHLCPVSWIDG